MNAGRDAPARGADAGGGTTGAASATAPVAHLASILLVGIGFGAYFVLRYLGRWTEQDTTVFARIITDMKDYGTLTSPGAYTHGYAYPVWASTVSEMAGLSVPDLLQVYLPLIGTIFLGVFGFATFRRLLGSDRNGLAAASLLFLVPELVFTVARGNHEKLTVSLTLLAILALVNGFVELHERRAPPRWGVFAAWTAVLVVTNFTLATLNSFFGSTFTVATTLALVFATALRLLRPRHGAKLGPVVRRLARIVAVLWLIVVLVVTYVYPSSTRSTQFVTQIVDRMTALVGAEPQAEVEDEPAFEVSDPYSVRDTDWISPQAYRIVSTYRWVLLLGSFASWLVLVVRAWTRLPATPLPRLFLIAFYGAYACILAVAVPIDFLNLSAGTNLQVRMYTYFAISATPLLAAGAIAILGAVRWRPASLALRGALVAALAVFALISVVKATLDPSVSNRWLLYDPHEVQAMRFWATRIWDPKDQLGPLSIEVQARPLYAYRTTFPEAPIDLNNFQIEHTMETAHVLASPLYRESVRRWERSPPVYWLENRTYDNGSVQIFHRIPRTPLQR